MPQPETYTIYHPPSLAEQNMRFYQAMLAARRAGLEKFVLGVVTAPGTDHAKFSPSRGFPMSGSSSPAASCAELGGIETDTLTTFR